MPDGPPESSFFLSSSTSPTWFKRQAKSTSYSPKIISPQILPIQDHALDDSLNTSTQTSIIVFHPSPYITMGSSSKSYTPSVASSTTSSSASYAKPSKSGETTSRRRNAFIQGAKKLLSELGSPPTAEYDRQARERGEQTPSQKTYYMPNQTPRRT